jgi:hypothetical protein
MGLGKDSVVYTAKILRSSDDVPMVVDIAASRERWRVSVAVARNDLGPDDDFGTNKSFSVQGLIARSREGQELSLSKLCVDPFSATRPKGLSAQSGNLAFRLGETFSFNFGCRVGMQIAMPVKCKKHAAGEFVLSELSVEISIGFLDVRKRMTWSAARKICGL